MATLRRLQLAFSCLLAVFLACGTALPPPALWQCHHSTRVVNAAFAAPLSAMPCQTSGPPMPRMACCSSNPSVSAQKTPVKQSLSRPACHPTLTRLAAFPAAGMNETRARLSLASLPAAFPLCAALLPSMPTNLTLRLRPPPTAGLSQSAPEHFPGLRAPPAA